MCLDFGERPFKKAFYSSTEADNSKYADVVRDRSVPSTTSAASFSSGSVAATTPSSSWRQQAAVVTGAPFATATGSVMRSRFSLRTRRGPNPLLLNGAMPCSDDMLGLGLCDTRVRYRPEDHEPDICEVDFFGLPSSSSATAPDNATNTTL